MENACRLDQICQILDKLTLDNLTLMEEHIQLKLNLENSMNDGETNLAKSRYILGHNKVSRLQLPTEDSQEMDPTAVVHAADDKLGYLSHTLEIVNKCESEEGTKIQDPLKWFGYLVPQNLCAAQANFRQALMWVVQTVNVQARLDYNCNKIGQLRAIKNTLGTIGK